MVCCSFVAAFRGLQDLRCQPRNLGLVMGPRGLAGVKNYSENISQLAKLFLTLVLSPKARCWLTYLLDLS